MKTWVRKTLSVGVLAAGALLFGPGVAHADTHQTTAGNNGILNGTQLVAPVTVPVNIVGNAIGVAGEARAIGVGKNRTEGGKVTQTSGFNNGILNGTQAYLPVNVPVNIVGNAVAVLGSAQAAGAGVNGRTESATVTEHGTHNGPGWGDQTSAFNNGIANGTQIYAPVDVPINICGNSLALLGYAQSGAVCSNESAESGRGAKQTTSHNNGILNGTQILAPISLPVNLAGNSAAVLGHSAAAAAAHNESAGGHGFDQTSTHNNGIGNGSQIAAPINAPINVCGNALGILGAADAAASCSNGGGVWGDHDHHGHGHGHGHDWNAGDNGGKDDYAGVHGDKPSGANGGTNGGTAYGSDSKGGSARPAMKSAEASPVGSLTKNASSLDGLDLLNTLG